MKRKLALLLVVLMVFMMTGITSFADEHVDEFTLLAGQDEEIGTVKVFNDGDYIYVNYILNQGALDEGWLIYETHVHVGVDLSDFPLNKKDNPQVGLFEFGKEHDGVPDYEEVIPIGDFVPGDNLMIAAHAVVEKEELIKEAPYFASTVLEYSQGTQVDLNSIVNERSNPIAALVQEYPDNVPDGREDIGFFSLGFMYDETEGFNDEGGWIEVEFDCPVQNIEGKADLRIWEATFGNYPPETADVYAWNGENWVWIGEANNSEQGPEGSPEALTVSDIELGALESTDRIRIVDTTNYEDFDGTNEIRRATADGFDLDGIQALNSCTETLSESAWADGTRFVDKGNWATYFEYTVHGEEYLETVTVDGKGAVAFTKNDLDPEKEYLIVASGTYIFAEWSPGEAGHADAKFNCRMGAQIPDLTGYIEGYDYYENDDGTIWINGDSFGYTQGLQLRINGDWAKWVGEYNDDHTYEKTITNYDGTLEFKIFDNVYSDNDGSLTVEIYEVW